MTDIDKDMFNELYARGRCLISDRSDPNGMLIPCGKPSVYSVSCQCERCEAEPGFHLLEHFCAEHYGKLFGWKTARESWSTLSDAEVKRD